MLSTLRSSSAPPATLRLVRRRWTWLGLILLFLGTAVCQAGEYGAVAISRSTGRWGSSKNYDTRIQAERAAKASCQTRDARSLTWVRNKYLALARSGTNFASGHASTARRAEYEALRRCAGGNPVIVTVFYSGR